MLVVDGGAPCAGAATGSSRRSTRAGRGRARSRGDLGLGHRRARGRARRASTPSASRRSGSPTSARRRCCGSATAGGRSRTPSSGRTGARRRCAPSSRRRGTSGSCASGRGSCSIPISRRRRSAGCSTTSRACATRAEAGEIAFGTVDSFLVWRLTGGACTRPTSPTPRARCSAISRTRRFSDELCALFGVPAALLPEVRPSAGRLGETRGVPGLPDGIPITGVAGDQQAALFGQDCIDAGDAKCTFGTGAFLLMNVGAEPRPSHARAADHGRLDAGRRRLRRRGDDRLRARGERLRRRRAGAVAARRARHHRAARRRSRRSRGRCPTPAASRSCPR